MECRQVSFQSWVQNYKPQSHIPPQQLIQPTPHLKRSLLVHRQWPPTDDNIHLFGRRLFTCAFQTTWGFTQGRSAPGAGSIKTHGQEVWPLPSPSWHAVLESCQHTAALSSQLPSRIMLSIHTHREPTFGQPVDQRSLKVTKKPLSEHPCR